MNRALMLNTGGLGKLYQGAEPDDPKIVDVDDLVLCWEEGRGHWHRFEGQRYNALHFPFFDDQQTIRAQDLPIIRAATDYVIGRLRLDKNVWVTCRMGLNRSGLIVACALHELFGWAGQRCIDYIQRRREGALFNPAFRAFLKRLPDAGRYNQTP